MAVITDKLIKATGPAELSLVVVVVVVVVVRPFRIYLVHPAYQAGS